MNEEINRVKKAAAKLYELSFYGKEPVSVFISEEVPYKKGNNAPPADAVWKKYSSECGWGGKRDAHWWFKVCFAIPERFRGKEVRLRFEEASEACEAVNPQFLVYERGKILSGMDTRHRFVVLPEDAEEVFIYAYSGMQVDRKLYITAYLYCADTQTEQLYYDFKIFSDALACMDKNEYRAIRLCETLNNAADLLDFRAPYSENYYKGLSGAKKRLWEGAAEIPDASAQEAIVHCIGHSHIDVAWLWTAEQSEEKAQRTFATALSLMDRYPQYCFMATQPCLYDSVKRFAPDVYERIKERTAEGRWQPEGGMWVEADCNLPCGESLMRQIEYGKKFFWEEFGVRSEIAWLPDCFGFPATLPQILKACGIRMFVTSKLGWNDTDRYPHDLFLWQGTDGTLLTSCLLTAPEAGGAGKVWTTYNGMAEPGQIVRAWNRYSEKDVCDQILYPFGYGDGGGGPTAEHLENIARMQRGVVGCPKTVGGRLRDYLQIVEEKAKKPLPVWRGELYLEFHRGTYTSMARNKRANRKYEFRLQNLEWLQSVCSLFFRMQADGEKTDRIWKLLLLNQFHDILPGSGIGEVYEESDRTYEKLETLLAPLEKSLTEVLTKQIRSSGGYLAINPNGTAADGVVCVKDKFYKLRDIPAKGWKVFAKEELVAADGVILSDFEMENACLKVRFNENYEIESVFDKRLGREMLRAGEAANVLTVYDGNLEYEFNAWEIKDFYKRVSYPVHAAERAEKVDLGARKGFRITRKYCDSEIVQFIFLEEGSALIYFDTQLDWKEPNCLLKTRFPMRLNAEYAECDIQFGTVKRPVTANTSWEKAKYEVCAHKFADLSQGDCGAALLNDSKYGYDFSDATLGLTLLKTSVEPNPTADIGKHLFRYALYIHRNSFENSDVKQVSYVFNDPVRVVPISENPNGALPDKCSFVGTPHDNICIETIRPSEGGCLIRAYEWKNCQTDAVFEFCADVIRAEKCDGLGNACETLATEGNRVKIPVSPRELITLRVYF